jgi:hypothetical protein
MPPDRHGTVRRLRTDESDGETDAVVEEFEAYDWYEAVDVEAVDGGDHLLVRAGEPIPVDGTVLAVQGLPKNDNSATEDEVSADPVRIEDEDGNRRHAVPGEPVSRDETVTGGSVVVEADGRTLLPWLPVIAGSAAFDWTGVVKFGVALVVIAITLSATGLGAFNPVNDFAEENRDRIAEAVGSDGDPEAGPTPPPEPVTVTPPDPPDDEDDDGGAEAPASTIDPPTETPTATASPTTAPPTTRREETDGDEDDDTTPVTADLDVAVADPGAVRNADGAVGAVEGSVDGTLTWNGRVDSVVVVVQSFVPGHGWVEVDRRTVRSGRPLDLGTAVGDTVYADGDRAAAFDNPTEGTTATHTGSVAVTAVLFQNGAEVERVRAVGDYTLNVTNVAPVELTAGRDGKTVELFDFGDTGSGADGDFVVPGSVSETNVPLTNEGDSPGTLQLSSVSYVAYENGQTGPEAAVDPTGGDPGRGAGELAGNLEVRLAVEYGNGTRHDVLGGPDEFRTLADLKEATVSLGRLGPGESLGLIVITRVPPAAGNEIQSDTVVVDVSFTLVAD